MDVHCYIDYCHLGPTPHPKEAHTHTYTHVHRGRSFSPSIRLPNLLLRQPPTLEYLCFCVFASVHSFYNITFTSSFLKKIYWPHHRACEILVQSGIEAVPLALEVQCLNHWTTGKSLLPFILVKNNTLPKFISNGATSSWQPREEHVCNPRFAG